MNRRRFLIGAAGLGIAVSSGAVLAIREPTIKLIESRCGQLAGEPKVLVTYASQFGSTGEVAAAIAQTLCESGVPTDVRLVTRIDDMSPYRAVIVGAPVHSNQWMPEATDFVRANRALLSKLPVGYFLTCMTLGVTDRAEVRQKIAGVLEQVQADIPDVVPVDKGLFAGALDYNKMSFIYRLIYQLMTPNKTVGDFRDWKAIRAWAEAIGAKLVS